MTYIERMVPLGQTPFCTLCRKQIVPFDYARHYANVPIGAQMYVEHVWHPIRDGAEPAE